MILKIAEPELQKLAAEFFALKSKEYDEVAINLVAFYASDEAMYHYMTGDHNPVMQAFVREFLEWVVPEVRRRKINRIINSFR